MAKNTDRDLIIKVAAKFYNAESSTHRNPNELNTALANVSIRRAVDFINYADEMLKEHPEFLTQKPTE